MRVDLSRMPSYPKTYVVDFPRLDGGLNIRELNYRLKNNESPNMKNLWWKDGVLQSRDGQEWLSDDESLGVGYACYERLWHGWAIFHIGGKLYYADPTAEEFTLTQIISGLDENPGTFFEYNDALFYKNRGAYIRLRYDDSDPAAPTIAGDDMNGADVAYCPVTVINASPLNGSGTLYQPENRLSFNREVWYNADGTSTVYHLPVTPVFAVTKVMVDGSQVPTTDYSVDDAAGTVTFNTAPDPGTPAANNTVKIVYSVFNQSVLDALASVMNCPYAAVAGNGNNLCILLGGCPAQPNAIFWNSNDSVGMNPGYFPMTNYNFCGQTWDAVTGFGRQYSDLIVFNEHSVGKLGFSVEQVDGRDSISFTYQLINDKIGCDLPRTIQLINNNLVFGNKNRGVMLIQSASAAYENNIICISEKVNGPYARGLLADIRQDNAAVSMDDNEHYWFCVNGHVWLWDYEDSSAADPSWYYFTEIRGVSYFLDDRQLLYHLDALGRVTKFGPGSADYGGAVDKVYTFATQNFGGYDRLKDMEYILLSLRSDADTTVQLRYDTDYERRVDLTPIQIFSWHLAPRDLGHRYLSGHRFGLVAKRKPGCRHIRHFSLTLANNRAGEDLAILTAQFFYRYSGKER